MSVNHLELFVDDIVSAMLSYDTIRVQRSTSETGPWSEITSLAAEAATLLSNQDSPYDVVGKTLTLQIDSASEEDIVFTGGVDPISVDSVAAQINAVFPGVASDDGGKLRLTSALTGTQSKVYIVGGGAAADLGFAPGQRDIGTEAYVTLVAGVPLYNFYDRDGGGASGNETFHYQVAFYNTATHLTSAWSDPFLAEPGTAVGADKLSVGAVDLVDARGVSKPNQNITFYPVYNPLRVENFDVALIREPVTITTNNSGHAEITLVRGLHVKVVFEGTNMIREIVVPDAPTFDLLQLMAAAPDPYNAYEPDYPTAPRRTL